MKIWAINDDGVVFDNGNTISDYHESNCCEFNFADYKAIDSVANA